MPTKNLRSIDNIDTNDMNFKHLETTKDIVISPKNEYGDPQRPDATHNWSAKVSDGTNYVGDYAVKINGASLIVDSEDFTKLPVGKYMLEVWEQWTDPDGNSQLSIYPSPQQTIPFTIYANIPDQAGKEIKKIGFQDVVDQAVMNIGMNYVFKVNTIEFDQAATVVQTAADGKNYVTFNIPRGAKGDKGDPGPQGPQGPQGPAGQNANDTTHILQSGDFNNIRTNGYYETSGTFANSPLNGEWGDLSVIAGEHYTRQVWTKGDSGEMFIRSRKYNSDNWTPWYKIGTYETSPYWQDSTVSYAHGVVVNAICDLRVKVRITSSSWHDLIHGLPEAAENFTFWWNGENYKPGKFSMNGDTLACRADQVDDYDVHLTYAVKM